MQVFAARCSHVVWIDETRIQCECPLCAATHGGTDPDRNLFATQDGDTIDMVCFAGHTDDDILAALNLTRADLLDPPPHTTTASTSENPSNGFSANGAAHHAAGNGDAPEGPATVDYTEWRYHVGMVIKKALDDVPEKERPTIASMDTAKLVDLLVGQSHEVVDEHVAPWWPLPEGLSESEVDEELHALAELAVEVFQNAYRPEPEAEEPKPEEKEQIRAYQLGELYEVIDEWERRPWVWDGILPHSSLSLIVGKSETGKSTDIYSLIYHIVTGTEFFGRTCEQGRVLYLAGDPMSEVVAGKIFRELGLKDGVVVVADALVMYEDGIQQLRRIVEDLKPTLIVGDTLAATIDLDVDKYGQSYRAQMPLTQIARDFGPNFLMSHHSQKAAVDSYSVIDAALGSVGVAAVASTRMSTKLFRRKGTKYYTFEMSNLRIGRPLEGEYIVHRTAEGLVELGGLWKVQNVQMDKDIILDVLGRQSEPMAKRTLWQECRPKPKWDPFNDALEELFAERKITIVTGPRGGRMYQLSDT